MLFHLLFLLQLSSSSALTLDVDSKDSICNATQYIQTGVLDYYLGTKPGGELGMFTGEIWWISGLVFGGMLEHMYLCDDYEYKNLVYKGIEAQIGENKNFLPERHSRDIGNDDQGIWGIALVGMIERNMTDSTTPGVPGWLSLAQAIFNTMYSRWDTSTCNGGLRWQIHWWHTGFNYKNTIANGCLFHLAARLGRYTGNTTYFEVANKIFDWLVDVHFVNLGDKARVYDGGNDECQTLDAKEWTYNYGIVLAGCAYMYNATDQQEIWKDRVSKILDTALKAFFDEKQRVMYERACQRLPDDATAHVPTNCNADQLVFKAMFSRMLTSTSVLAPFTKELIEPYLTSSALAAARSCSGGIDGHTCGLVWQEDGYDGQYGLGEQISALETIQSCIAFIHSAEAKAAPVSESSGGVSQGNPAAGFGTEPLPYLYLPGGVKVGDRVASAFVTTTALLTTLGINVWMVI